MAHRLPDIVVFIPGLIGSILSKDDKPLWGWAPGAIWRLKTGTALDTLELKSPDNGEDDLGDGIVPTGLLNNVEIIPGFWKKGGYSILMRHLQENLALDPGRNYFEFPYDWRRDNRVSARKLSRSVAQWLGQWRAESGNADAKVIFVVHSMGGLVARYFMECLEGWKDTRMLVSIGTPFRGSGNALGFLSNGYVEQLGLVELFDATRALRSFDSTYQLLPTYGFIDTNDAELTKVSDVAIANVDRARAKAALKFHEEICEAQKRNAALEAYRLHGPKVRPIVGIDQPTALAARFVDGARIELINWRKGKDLKGDGTVPRIAAVPDEMSEDGATFVPNTHSALQSTEGALGHIRGLISGVEITPDDRRHGDLKGKIGLSVRDAYRAGDPIQVKATASEFAQTLAAKVVRLDEAAPPTQATLWFDAGAHVGNLRLEAGLYQIEVSGEGNQPVSDVFLVVEQ